MERELNEYPSLIDRIKSTVIKQAVEKITKKQDGQDKSSELIFEYIDRLQEKAELPSYKGVTVVSGFDVGKVDEKDVGEF